MRERYARRGMAAKRFPDRDEIAAVRAEAERLSPGKESPSGMRVAGRVMARRGHGKLTFLDLVDRSGRVQLLCAEDRCGPIDLNLGDIVGASGFPARTRRGEPSLAVEEIEVLAPTRKPLPDTFHGLVDAETRYRKRYLDLLVNEEIAQHFILRSRIVTAIRRYLDARGFIEVETPMLQPRYGGAFARALRHPPQRARRRPLPANRDELYLKRLIVGGLEKVYEIGKDFRNEGISYKHQPEFTMLEWYEAYADYRDTMARIEDLIETVACETIGTTGVTFRGHEVDLRAPWRRVKLVDALAEHDLWTRDEGELRARLETRGTDTSRDRHGLSSSTMLCRPTSSLRSSCRRSSTTIPSSFRRSPGRRRRPDHRRALRVLRLRDGARERVHRDQRRRGAGRAVPDAGDGEGGR